MSSHSLSSNASLPSVQSCRRLRERRAASWAVSFERLLQDPLGVRYFSVSRVGLGRLWFPLGSSGRTLAQASARGLRPQDSGGGVVMRPRSPTAGVPLPLGPWGSALGQRAPEASHMSARPTEAAARLRPGGRQLSVSPPRDRHEGCSCPCLPGRAKTRKSGSEDAASSPKPPTALPFPGGRAAAHGRHLPQDFLRKEFSEENILFWQACEGFNHVPAHDKKEVRLRAGGGHPIHAKVLSRRSEHTVFSE